MKVVILIGGSGTGKTTTEKEIVKRGLAKSIISYTSRPIRDCEVDKVDYNFVSIEEIEKLDKANQIIISKDWQYAVAKSSFNNQTDLVYSVINIAPALELKKYAESIGYEVEIVVFNIPKEIRHKHMIERGETEESIKTRLGREDSYDSFNDYNHMVSTLSYDTQDEIINKIWQQ